MPTYRLKYLPKNDVLAKLSELEISWMKDGWTLIAIWHP